MSATSGAAGSGWGRGDGGSGVWSDTAGGDVPPPWPEERYEVRGVLGVGGMGRVLLAYDHVLRREVAVKELLEGGTVAEARLQAEAELTAGLEHPGIVSVHDAGVRGTTRYYVMRVVRGRSLAEVLAEAPSMSQVRPFLAACQAVAFAHGQGVVHRDLKPSNIMVGAFGETQVMDWGFAARLGPDGAAPGMVVGTPGWMSPEQAAGRPVDARTDVWALGAVLEAVAGDGATPELKAVVARCKADDPADRYRDAGALADDVAAWLDGRRVSAHDYTPRELLERLVRAWRVPLAVGATALVVLAVVVASATLRVASERDRATAAAQAAEASLAQADAALALSLSGQAADAAVLADCARAEPLAVAALRRGEAPLARGALAACGARPRARRVASWAVPRCAWGATDARGQRLACVIDDAVVVLEVASGRELARFRYLASDVALDASGRFLAINVPGAEYRHVVVRSVDEPHRAPIVDVGHATGNLDLDTRDDELIVAGESRTPSRVLSLRAPGEPALFALEAAGAAIVAADADPSGSCVIEDPDVLTCERQGRRRSWQLPQLDARLRMGTLERVGPDVLLGTTTGLLARFDPEEGRLVSSLMLDQGVVRQIHVHPSRPDLALVVCDRSVSVVDHRRMEEIARLPGSGMMRARWGHDDEVWTGAGRLDRWEVPLRPSRHVHPFPEGLSRVEASPDGARMAVAGAYGIAEVVDVVTGEPLQHLAHVAARDEVVKGVTWTSDGARLVAWGGHHATSLWRGQTLERRFFFSPAAASLDRRVVVLAGDALVRLSWHPGLVVQRVDGTEAIDLELDVAPDDVGVSAHGAFAAVLGADGQVWRVPAVGPPAYEVIATSVKSGLLDITDDGRTLVVWEPGLVWSETDGVRTWSIDPGSDLMSLALSPDGRWVAGGKRDGVVQVWSMRDGAVVAELTGHRGRVSSLDFTRDGRTLLSASWDRSVRRWDVTVLEEPVESLAARLADPTTLSP